MANAKIELACQPPALCLIYSAGIADARPVDQVEPASYERAIPTNLLGVLNGTDP